MGCTAPGFGLKKGRNAGGLIHDGFLDLPSAHDRPQRRAIAACASSKEPRAAAIAASFARQWQRRPAGRTGPRLPGRVRCFPMPPEAIRATPDRAEHRGQQPAVPGLQLGPGDPAARFSNAPGRGCSLACRSSRTLPQVERILQQLKEDIAAPLVQGALPARRP